MFPLLEERRRRLPRLPVAVAALSAIGAVIWAGFELECPGTQTWTAAHPVFVTFVVGLVLLILTVFAVERWLAWSESRHWRAPALAALDAYIQKASAVHRHLRREFRGKFGLKPEPISEGVDLRVEALLPEAAAEPFNEFAELVRGQMAELATTVLLTIQTVARHEPFEGVLADIAEQQRRLSALAADSVAMYGWARHRDALAAHGKREEDTYFDGLAGDIRDTARHMNEVFTSYSNHLGVLKTQVDNATRALAGSLAKEREREIEKRANPGLLAHLRHPILAVRVWWRDRKAVPLEQRPINEILPGYPMLEEVAPADVSELKAAPKATPKPAEPAAVDAEKVEHVEETPEPAKLAAVAPEQTPPTEGVAVEDTPGPAKPAANAPEQTAPVKEALVEGAPEPAKPPADAPERMAEQEDTPDDDAPNRAHDAE